MNPAQAEHPRSGVDDLRSRLQDVTNLLSSVASAGGVEAGARKHLEFAIESIQAVSEDLAAVCDERPADVAGGSFRESRAREAKSEVDSGEFDMHG